MAEFTYRNDEWIIDDVVVYADVELTLRYELDWADGEPDKFTVAGVWVSANPHTSIADACPPDWLRRALCDWVENNQPVILQAFYDANPDTKSNEHSTLNLAQQGLSSRRF
jgi:hypothetical protein